MGPTAAERPRLVQTHVLVSPGTLAAERVVYAAITYFQFSSISSSSPLWQVRPHPRSPCTTLILLALCTTLFFGYALLDTIRTTGSRSNLDP